jgi:D-glutamate cyclase
LASSLIEQIEALIRRDPAGRGLMASEPDLGPLCLGHLKASAQNIAADARHAAIVTGFFVPDGQPAAAETDGPPGAVVLAYALQAIGVDVTLVTDSHCANALFAAASAAGFDESSIAICPNQADVWLNAFFEDDPGRALTHLIAIERVGPSHDENSLVKQTRTGPAPVAEFLAAVPPEHRNRCHNLRGALIDDSTVPLHRLFEIGPRRIPRLVTIGIGDGGNEIGMGAIPWEEIARRLPSPAAASTPCRIATTWNIIAGTSNWGAFGLAAATLVLADRTAVLEPLDEEFHRTMLERMIVEGPAVDGITRLQFRTPGREPTVDGLPFSTYIQIWLGIRRMLGFGH